MERGVRGSTRGEGFGPTVELACLGGEEGQESIGLAGRLTTSGRKRLLGRSKALKSRLYACFGAVLTGLTSSREESEGALCLHAPSMCVRPLAAPFQVVLLPEGRVADVGCRWRGRRVIPQDVRSSLVEGSDELCRVGATVNRPELAERQESNGRREALRLTGRGRL